MIGTRRAETSQPRQLLAGAEIEHRSGIREMAHLHVVGRGQPADDRSERGSTRPTRVVGQWFESGDDRSERLGVAAVARKASAVRMISSEFASHASLVSPQAVMPWPPRMTPIASRVGLLHGGDLEAELEPRTPPRHPYDAVAEALLRQRLAVGRRRQRDPGVGMEMIDVRGVDESMHGGVDRRCCAAAPMEAVVEGGDHLVFSIDPGIDVGERAHAIEPKHGETFLRQRAEVAAGALHPQQLDRTIGDGIGPSPFAEVFPPA